MRAVLLAVLSLLLPTAAAAKPIQVVATVPDLAAIAAEVGGDHVVVRSMALPTQDPHFLDAKPSLALALSRADLLLLTGLDLEVGWLPTLVTASRNPRIQTGARGRLDCSTLVSVLGQPTGPVDRSMGDVHTGGNPHYLFDPRRARDVALGIADRLAELDPEHAGLFEASAATFIQRLDAAIARWQTAAEQLRGQPVITYHRSLVYLADWLGFVVPIAVEPKPGIPPSARHIATVLATARSQGVKLVLQESFYPDRESRLVADKAGARLVVLHAGTDFQAGESYVEHMDELIAALTGEGS